MPTHNKGEAMEHEVDTSKLLGEHHFTASVKEVKETKDGVLSIEGWANRYKEGDEEIIDRDGEIILPSAYDLDNFKKNPIMLYMHDRYTPVGKITSIGVTSDGLYVKGEVHRDLNEKVYKGVEEGILQTFSVGFRGKQGAYAPDIDVYYYTGLELYEVSIVTVPANQDSVFSVVDSPCTDGMCVLGVQHASTKDFGGKMSKQDTPDTETSTSDVATKGTEEEEVTTDSQKSEEDTIYTLEQLEQLKQEVEKAIQAVRKDDGEEAPDTEPEPDIMKEEQEGEPTASQEEETPSGDSEDVTSSSVTVAEAIEVIRGAVNSPKELETLVEFYETFTNDLDESVEAYLTAASEIAE
jgi:HK97 family phage prohead protease